MHPNQPSESLFCALFMLDSEERAGRERPYIKVLMWSDHQKACKVARDLCKKMMAKRT